MPKVAKKTRHNLSESSRKPVSRRFESKCDARDLPVVKFRVEELGNKACCCSIGR
jgi:hypothetical protein